MVYESRVGRRLHPGHQLLADRGHHPRPGAGLPRSRRAGPAAVLEGRPARPPARTGPRGRRVPARGRRPAPGGRPAAPAGRRAWTPGPPTMSCRTWPNSARPAATSPTTGRSWSSGSVTSWATGGSSSTPPSAPRCTPPGRSRSAPGSSERYGMDAQVMHADDGIVLRLPDADLMGLDLLDHGADAGRARSTTPSRPRSARPTSPSTRARSTRSSPTRSAAPRCSPPASASAPPARCCCRAAARASAPRCGSSASAPPSCSRWPSEFGSFPIVLEAVRECLQDVFDVPGPHRADGRHRGPPGPAGRGHHAGALPLRPLPALRLRRPVPVRGRLAARRAPGGRAVAGLPAAGRAAGPGGAARTAGRRGAGRSWSGSSSGSPRTAGSRTPRASPTCCGCSARSRTPSWPSAAPSRRGREELAAARRAIRVRIGGRASTGRRSRTRAGCATRWARRCRSACRRRSPSRSRTRSATCWPGTPAPTARSPRPRPPPASAWARP